jgi:hypothetical protein
VSIDAGQCAEFYIGHVRSGSFLCPARAMASDRERPEAFTSGRFEYGASARRFCPHLQIFKHTSIIGVVERCERLDAHCCGLGILHAVGIDPDQLSAVPLEIPGKRLAGRRIYRNRTFAARPGIFYDVTKGTAMAYPAK